MLRKNMASSIYCMSMTGILSMWSQGSNMNLGYPLWSHITVPNGEGTVTYMGTGGKPGKYPTGNGRLAMNP